MGKSQSAKKNCTNEFARDEKYKAWIRTLPCCVRGPDCYGPIEAHHTARAYGGIRGSDYSCVPICSGHHTLAQYHQWVFKRKFNFIPDENYAQERYYERYGRITGRGVSTRTNP